MTEANVVLAALLGAAVVVPVAGQERHASHFDGPKPAQSVVPDYPPIAVAACVQGTASIVVELDQDGRVTGTDFISGSPLFEEAAVEASRRWRFESGATPGRRRQVLQFSFGIVRRYWGPGGTCSDCSREASIRMAREEERRCAG
jgi:TonB family protein